MLYRTIVERADGFHVLSSDGDKNLGGPYASREEAESRLAEVEHFKNRQARFARQARVLQITDPDEVMTREQERAANGQFGSGGGSQAGVPRTTPGGTGAPRSGPRGTGPAPATSMAKSNAEREEKLALGSPGSPGRSAYDSARAAGQTHGQAMEQGHFANQVAGEVKANGGVLGPPPGMPRFGAGSSRSTISPFVTPLILAREQERASNGEFGSGGGGEATVAKEAGGHYSVTVGGQHIGDVASSKDMKMFTQGRGGGTSWGIRAPGGDKFIGSASSRKDAVETLQKISSGKYSTTEPNGGAILVSPGGWGGAK